jgi:hypothetical protein
MRTAAWLTGAAKIDHSSVGVTVGTTSPSSGTSPNGRTADESRKGLSAAGRFTKVATVSQEQPVPARANSDTS